MLQLQEVGLWEVHTPTVQQVGVLLLVGDTTKQIQVVQTEHGIVGQRVLNKEVSVGALVSVKTLVALVEVHTVALNPCRHPSLVLGVSLAIREVQLIIQLVVLALHANHLQQVYFGRTGSDHAVNDGITCHEIIHEQGVRSRDITVDGVVVHTIAVGVVVVTAGRAHLVVEHPGRGVVSLDGGLH